MKAKAMIDKKSGKTSLKFNENRQEAGSEKKKKKEEKEKEEEVQLQDCFGSFLTSKVGCMKAFSASKPGKAWFQIRKFCFNIVNHRFFEWFILLIILISSVSLVRLSANQD